MTFQKAVSTAEEELEFRRALEEAIPAGFAMTDREGRQCYVNPYFCKMVGWSEEELVGAFPPYVYWPADEIETIRKAFELTLEGKAEPGGLELRFQRRNGERFDVLVSVAPVKNRTEDELLGWVALVTDITERKKGEEAIRESEGRLRVANQIKDDFLATLSHELRTPLTSVLGWARMLRIGQLDQQTYNRALESIERNAKAQAQLVDDLLDISKIMRGKLQLERRRFSVQEVIEAAVDSIRPAASAKGLTLKMLLDPEAGTIEGDSSRLQQVIWNLLSNAVKFTSKGGEVKVELKRSDSRLDISVSDNGKGISSDFLPYVFERFRQADRGTTRKYGGLGLGLSIVKQIIELHGGVVRVESEGEGEGSKFTVSLPGSSQHGNHK